MRYHIIACGGSIMHQLTIQLARLGNEVTGSDDEIFEPAYSNLQRHQLLPQEMGWHPELLNDKIDIVIVGMHAKADNPELARAKELGLRLMSYPEFIYEHAKNKKRVAIAGSHGKTSTTAMVMHVLKEVGMPFDFLVGAKLEGFDYSLQLSDAPLMILEADEYPDSADNKLPKFLFYKPHIASISGIAWDHVNVFPTFENYVHQFDLFIDSLVDNATLIYNNEDEILKNLCEQEKNENRLQLVPFHAHPFKDGSLVLANGDTVAIEIFGTHNLFNLSAAKIICLELGIPESDFCKSIATFKGAAKRLQLIRRTNDNELYLDFAHAPSKVKATVAAMKEKHPNRELIACLELHTFSSLNEEFIGEYKSSLDAADIAIVFYDPHAFELKRLPVLSPQAIVRAFGNNEIKTFSNPQQLSTFIKRALDPDMDVLMMSSGNFGGLGMEQLAKFLFD